MKIFSWIPTPRIPRSPHQVWLLIFCLWLLLLSGGFAAFIGSPGILQAVQLNQLLTSKQMSLAQMKADIQKLHLEVSDLKANNFAQEREIRRVLGYTAPDELLFDF